MSRSFMKSPVLSPKSAKLFLSKVNRRTRNKVRRLLLAAKDFDQLVLPVADEMVEMRRESPKRGRCNMFGDKSDEVQKLMRK